MVKSDAGAVAQADGSITLEGLAAIVAGLAKAVEGLARRAEPAAVPGHLPHAKTTKELLSGMRRGELRQGQTRVDMYGQTPAFRADDVVRLLPGDKLTQMQQLPIYSSSDDNDVLGVVKAFMYRRRRDGKRKYKVDFGAGVGEDGLMEDEIELVQAA